MALHQKNHQAWSLEGTERNKTSGRERERWRGGDSESGQTCSVLLGHSSAHGLSARLKDTLGFKREPWRFFFSVYKTYLFIFMSLSFIYFSLSQHPLLCRWNRVRVTPSRVSFHLPPPCLLIPLQLKNQTALKQIDVLFNIVVTSSQGPHASALVTTAGLLSLAQRWLPLCWSLQWFITKKREREAVGVEREGGNGSDRRNSPLDYDWVTATFDWQGLISLSPF